MVLGPGKHLHVSAGLHGHEEEHKDEEGQCDDQRKDVGGIDTRKACPPERTWRGIPAGIGINENEAGKYEEETHADIADRSEILVPLRTRSHTNCVQVKD